MTLWPLFWTVRKLGLFLTVFLFISCAVAQEKSVIHGEHSGDLVSALEFVSTTFRVPIIAEITSSYPPHVGIPKGDGTYEKVLTRLTTKFPNYGWTDDNGVVFFYDKLLRNAPKNFFNSPIARFVMPSDAAELKLELNQAMGTGTAKEAPVMAGIPNAALETVKLRKGEVLTNTTGREILIGAAKQSRNIFSVVLFPTDTPKTKRDKDQAHMNWFVRSIDELATNPTRLRSIPLR